MLEKYGQRKSKRVATTRCESLSRREWHVELVGARDQKKDGHEAGLAAYLREKKGLQPLAVVRVDARRSAHPEAATGLLPLHGAVHPQLRRPEQVRAAR